MSHCTILSYFRQEGSFTFRQGFCAARVPRRTDRQATERLTARAILPTVPTPHVRFCHDLAGFLAHGGNAHLLPEPQAALHAPVQHHVRTRIGPKDAGHWARLTQGRFPCVRPALQQAADLGVAASRIVAVKESALLSCGRLDGAPPGFRMRARPIRSTFGRRRDSRGSGRACPRRCSCPIRRRTRPSAGARPPPAARRSPTRRAGLPCRA